MKPPAHLRRATASLPTDRQLRIMFGVVTGLVVALLAVAPYARQPTQGTEIFVAAYAAGVCIIEATTAVILLSTFAMQRTVPLLILAAGYLLSASLVLPWALTFPGIFTVLGWDDNLQATAWIAAVRRIGFACAVLGYATARPTLEARRPGRWILGCVVLMPAFAAAVTWLVVSEDASLPDFMADARNTAPAWGYVPPLALALYAAAGMALLRRKASTLDIWMLVVLISLCAEIALISYMGGGMRLSVGWWSGRSFGLLAALIILVVLLAEAGENHARLTRLAAVQTRARRNRLTAMEALSASIAHEVNQPLTSIVVNANAGIRWLARPSPEIGQARQALERIVEEGHRADKIVAGIRTMFTKGAQERKPVDLDCVVGEALDRCASEPAMAGVTVEKTVEAGSTHVVANPVQLLQVVSNIIENALDAMKDGLARERRLVIRIARAPGGEVEASFADTGPGIDPSLAERIFEPFVSGKPDGMGMGLMFCRTVIEAHGGRIAVSANEPFGAVFRFWLPESTIDAPAVSSRAMP